MNPVRQDFQAYLAIQEFLVTLEFLDFQELVDKAVLAAGPGNRAIQVGQEFRAGPGNRGHQAIRVFLGFRAGPVNPDLAEFRVFPGKAVFRDLAVFQVIAAGQANPVLLAGLE